MRSDRDYVDAELRGGLGCAYGMIWKATFESVTPEKAAGWFRDCGYM